MKKISTLLFTCFGLASNILAIDTPKENPLWQHLREQQIAQRAKNVKKAKSHLSPQKYKALLEADKCTISITKEDYLKKYPNANMQEQIPNAILKELFQYKCHLQIEKYNSYKR